MQLSVLDLIPVRHGQTSRHALLASQKLARTADEYGYRRYWVAEHHNMRAVASTSPAVLIPFLAEKTKRIRFGSGGVMLPNHSALVVAEQFALLQEMYPGRIDLGLGRAPGTDQLVASLLRGNDIADSTERFDQDVQLLRALLDRDDGTKVKVAGRSLEIRATPSSSGSCDVWILGSSGYSLQLAAKEGFPYVFAHHFGIPGIESALRFYRQSFVPSPACPEPKTLVPVNVVIGSTKAEAERLAGPHLLTSARLRTGQVLGAQPTTEEAASHQWSEAERGAVAAASRFAFVGTAGEVAESLLEFADQLTVDELMIVPVAGASQNEELETSPARLETIRLLGELIL